MKLLGTPTSPYARKVRIMLAEKHIDYEFVVDFPRSAASHVPRYNPLGKVPVLVLDDESTLFDSRVIVEYLDSASPVGRMIPDDIRQRIQVRRWEALADGCTEAAAAVTIEKRRPADKQSPEWMVRQQGKAERALKALAEDLGDQPWCSGDAYNLSDIAVGCSLGVLDLMLPDLNWRKMHPNLSRLFDKLSQRPSFKDTAPPKTLPP